MEDAGSPVLTPLSFAHIPPPLPRSSRKMLATLSSLQGFGLRFAPTISTGTLGFSRLARRSIFIVLCTLADSLYEPFTSRASTARSPCRVASTASGWNVSCRAGYLPPTGFRRHFHGAPELRPRNQMAKLQRRAGARPGARPGDVRERKLRNGPRRTRIPCPNTCGPTQVATGYWLLATGYWLPSNPTPTRFPEPAGPAGSGTARHR
jgi:hypothetical protein